MAFRTQTTASNARTLVTSLTAARAKSRTICSARILSACPSASGSATSASRSPESASFATSRRNRGRRLVNGSSKKRKIGWRERMQKNRERKNKGSVVSRKSRESWRLSYRRWSSKSLGGSKWQSKPLKPLSYARNRWSLELMESLS